MIIPSVSLTPAKAEDYEGEDLDLADEFTDEWGDTGDYQPTDEEIQKAKDNAPPKSVASFYSQIVINHEETESDPLQDSYRNIFENIGPKIIFNSADAEDIRALNCLANAIPSYEADLGAIVAVRPDLTLEYLTDLKNNSPEKFSALVTDLKEKDEASLPETIKNDIESLACLTNTTTEEADYRLKTDAESFDLEIENAIAALKIDKRIFRMLIYLVTPKNQGGAGHERIKVYRMRKDYALSGHQEDRESQAILEEKAQVAQSASEAEAEETTVAEAQEETSGKELSSDEINALATGEIIDEDGETDNRISDFVLNYATETNDVLSAHATGQAVDISEVDNIRCTKIGRVWIGPTQKDPIIKKPIELLWQTEEGYAASSESRTNSVNSLVNGMYRDGIVDLLEELELDINNIDDLSAANLGDLLGIIGQGIIGQLVNAPEGTNFGNNLEETIKTVGAAYLADKLSLPRAALYGGGYSDLNDLQTNLGRATIESKLALPFGSLTGNNAIEIFYNIGQRKVEKELELPIDTLTPDITTEEQLIQKVGAAVIEDRANFNNGSFQADDLNAIKRAAGSIKFDAIFSLPQLIDVKLNLESGTTARFLNGSLSARDFRTTVAYKHLADRAYYFNSYTNCQYGSDCESDEKSMRGAVYNSPATSFEQVLLGQMSYLPSIGRDEIVKKLTSNDKERQALLSWLVAQNGNPDAEQPPETIEGTASSVVNGETVTETITVSENRIMARLNINQGDLYFIFGSPNDTAEAIFSRLGGERLYQAVIDSPDFAKVKREFLAHNPGIADIIEKVEFYKEHYDSLENHLKNIEKNLDDINNDPKVDEGKVLIQQALEMIRALKDKNSIGEYAKGVGKILNKLSQARGKIAENSRFKSEYNQILREIDQAVEDLSAILNGNEDSRLTSLKFSEFMLKSNSYGDDSGGKNTFNLLQAIWLLVTGQATLGDTLIAYGGNQLENSLDLPENTFYYYIKNGEQKISGAEGEESRQSGQYNREGFMAALGQAAIEEAANLNLNTFRGEIRPNKFTDQTIDDIVNYLAKDSSASSAKTKISRAFGTSVGLDLLITGDSTAWSQAKTDITKYEQKIGIKKGTVQAFLTKSQIQLDSSAYLSADELDLLSARLNVSTGALTKLTKVLAGDEAWEYNPVSFKTYNPYLKGAQSLDNTACQQAATEDYTYTDLDGVHTFKTLELAKRYYNLHKDRRLDYIGEISLGINSVLGNDPQTKEKLTNYLQDINIGEGFDGTILTELAANGNIPKDILERLFTRKTNDGDLFSFLVSVGEQVGNERVKNALLGSFGVTVGGQKLDTGDLFSILNGESDRVVNKIAGGFLDDALSFDNGTFESILGAESASARECLIRQAGADWLMRQYGIRDFPIYGNIYHALGGRKIESVLNWPSETFKSNSPNNDEGKDQGLKDLIENVGIIRFFQAFEIPLAGLGLPESAEKIIANSKASDFAKIDNYQILNRIDNAYSLIGPDDDPDGSKQKAFDELTVKMLGRVSLLQDENLSIWQLDLGNTFEATTGDFVDENATAEAIRMASEIATFRKRVEEIDIRVGASRGNTKKLLLGQMTPDSYRDQISNKTAYAIAGGLLIDTLITDNDKASAIKDGLRAYERIAYNNGRLVGDDAGKIYDAFDKLFSINLDEKLKFREGTIREVVVHPENAKTTLIAEGLYRLDQSLFKDDRTFSTEEIFLASVDGIKVRECDLSQGRLSVCRTTVRKNQDGMIAAAAGQLADWVAAETHDSIGLSGDERNYLAQFFRTGDMRVMQMLGNAVLADKINNLREQTSTRLPGGYQVTWGDIYDAVIGNRDLEDYASNRAEMATLVSFDNSTYSTAQRERLENGSNSYSAYDGYGAPASGRYGQVSWAQESRIPISDTVIDNTNYVYELPEGYTETQRAELIAKYLTPPDPNNPIYQAEEVGSQRYIDDLGAYYQRQETYKTNQEAARDQVRREFTKNLEYRYVDSLAYQLDRNIPPGFARALFEGNAKTRADMLYAWLRNGITSGKLFGSEIDAGLRPALAYLIDTAVIGNKEAFDSFLGSGIDTFDRYFSEQFNNLFGVNFIPGTFKALVAGTMQGGNYSADFEYTTGSGQKYKFESLKTVYTNFFVGEASKWLDNTLGLPKGTSMELYKVYRAYEAYRGAKTAYVAAGAVYQTTQRAFESGQLLNGQSVTQEMVNSTKSSLDGAQTKVDNARQIMNQLAATVATTIVNAIFEDTFTEVDQSIGLVPGSTSMVVGQLIGSLFNVAMNPLLFGASFLVLNLFGVHKVELRCTADGYFPELGSVPSSNVADVGYLGVFDGANSEISKQKYIEAAQYKARRLLGDVLEMPEKLNDRSMTPSQIMTGRKEDVDYWFNKTSEVIYKYTGGPDKNGDLPSRAGLWYNPQTIAYTHIGF